MDTQIPKAHANPKQPCSICLNARVSDGELTDENDLHVKVVATAGWISRIVVENGGGKPLRIIAERLSKRRGEWLPEAEFRPRFCPFCGRELTEYDE